MLAPDDLHDRPQLVLPAGPNKVIRVEPLQKSDLDPFAGDPKLAFDDAGRKAEACRGDRDGVASWDSRIRWYGFGKHSKRKTSS